MLAGPALSAKSHLDTQTRWIIALSEPYSALLRLQLRHEDLSRWLAAPLPSPSRWSDWRCIAGPWRLGNGECLASSSDEALDELLVDCQALLARYPDNRAALKAFLASAQAENIQVAAYDRTGTHFVAGSLTYSESLYDLIAFLTVARGAADFLKAGDHGVALVHDYLWAEEGERETVAAIALAGQGQSGFFPRTWIPLPRPSTPWWMPCWTLRTTRRFNHATSLINSDRRRVESGKTTARTLI